MEEVHSLVKHGGGYTFTDVWNMPVSFRRGFIGMIIKENETMKKKQEQQQPRGKNKRK